jgi:hypothetical protein
MKLTTWDVIFSSFGYPHCFIDPVINSKDNTCPDKEVKALGFVYIPYVKGIQENLNL